MNIIIKKTKVSLLLLSIIGLMACNHTTSRKIKNNVTVSEINLEADIKEYMIVPVTIKNKNYNFLVNTGASVNVIDEKLVNTISSPYLFSDLPHSYQETFSEQDIIKESKKKYVKAQPFFIGKQEIKGEDFWLSMDISALSKEYGIKLDGMIGMETFRKFSWQVDNIKKRLIVTKDAPSAFSYTSCVSYSNQSYNAPEVSLQHDEESEVVFKIKTGDNYSNIGFKFNDYLNENKKDKIEFAGTKENININGVEHKSNYYKLRGMTFNNMLLGEIFVDISEEDQYSLGMDFLSRFTNYAFIPSRMMFCYNASPIKNNHLPTVRDIVIIHINNRLELFDNADDKLFETGLKNGDIIISANDKKYEPYDIFELRKLFSITPKGELKLVIERNMQQLELQI